MKILHTSDWHIGKRLRGHSMQEDHELFFEWLIDTIESKKIDILLIAGDVFDVAHPSNEAMQQYYHLLLAISKTCCQHIVITGGNHDSVHTLNAPKEILKFLNVHVVGGATSNIEDEILRFNIKDEKVIICAVPFLRDKDVKKATEGESYEDRIEAVKEGILNHYRSIAKAVEQEAAPKIATGHLYVQNSNLSDSERDIQVGNLAGIEGKKLSDLFDYIALGHVHIPQKIAGADNMWYSGSPIPLSFKERKDSKLILIIDTSKEHIHEIEKIPVPNFRRLIRFEGTFSEIQSALLNYKKEGRLKDWGEVQLIEETYDPSIADRLSAFLSTITDLEILKYSIQFANKIEGADELFGKNSITELDPKEVFEKRIKGDQIENAPELEATFSELIDWMQTTEDEN